ncbi:E3 SUMO-protein ligase SIZ1-like isoform X2 [Phoenix dactylifera]|uniref:E3 SUMO-protein ligase SIZ1-like isoform X2 n=1 Tax=Phoenix dactylifera TaxID=42345 RepID=A0A8B9A5E5_PHODC|nr:E3 SUMO-protein ligase SIZ1-like isoform X2 [Phoenix dactylifera]
MDLAASCRDKLVCFRIKELKDVLTQLGLAKQGKKQELVDRILALLSDEQVSKSHGWTTKISVGKEQVAKIIDDTYRKVRAPGATDLAPRNQSGSVNNVEPKKEVNDHPKLDMKVRCPCSNSLLMESMIKCEESRCQVWQHLNCVIIPENPMEGALPEIPPHFYCEICRINRADPFWLTIAHPLLPVKLASSSVADDGTNAVQSDDMTFILSRADRDMLQRTEFDLQIWCILLNDKVPFRMQWPLYADLRVNGILVRTTNRTGSQQLGINGRDDGPVITTFCREGTNEICLSRCDARIFCLGIRIARRRTIQEVLNLVPKEEDGEQFGDALARVCRCVGGGTATDDADSDRDIEVVADSVTVDLRCPMTQSRMKIAGRFRPCAHMGCFDLESFVELNQRSRKWQCPICLRNYSLENIIMDPYFNHITYLMRNCGEDVNEIDVKLDGSWRVKNVGEHKDLGKWHLPDGSLYVANNVEVKPDVDIMKQIKTEGFSEGHNSLKLGIKKNHNGIWEVSKPEDIGHPSSENHVLENFENHCQDVIPMSGSPTGSYRDGEDPSANQEGRGHYDFSVNNGHELDCLSVDIDPTFIIEDKIFSAPLNDANIIVLSDSDEDNVTLISSRTAYDTGPADDTRISFPISHPGAPGTNSEELGLRTSGTSGLGFFNNDNDDFGLPLWPLQSCPQTGPGFQLFGGGLGETSQAHVLSTGHSYAEVNGGLVDNPLAIGDNDPSLQIYLPSQPTVVAEQAETSNHGKMVNGVHSDDWISLTLGDANGGDVDPASTNEFCSTQQESGINSLANAASMLQSMDDGRVNKTSSRQRSYGPFSPPRQPRSVRPRLYLSIDTDSD